MANCAHIPTDLNPPTPSGMGCFECEAVGRRDWVHLRLCQKCGHVGCCDNSPGKHATGHHRETGHELIRSFEPGEDWWWCYIDEEAFMVPGAPPSPSY